MAEKNILATLVRKTIGDEMNTTSRSLFKWRCCPHFFISMRKSLF